TVGGVIVDNTSWRWIFFVNVPIGGIALLVIALTMPRHERTTPHTVDWTGAALLAAATTGLLLALLSIQPVATAALALVAGTLLVVRTRRVPEPIVPLGVVRERIVATGGLATGLSVMAQFG